MGAVLPLPVRWKTLCLNCVDPAERVRCEAARAKDGPGDARRLERLLTFAVPAAEREPAIELSTPNGELDDVLHPGPLRGLYRVAFELREGKPGGKQEDLVDTRESGGETLGARKVALRNLHIACVSSGSFRVTRQDPHGLVCREELRDYFVADGSSSTCDEEHDGNST